jgi:mono/diheme cytochrome c family protein
MRLITLYRRSLAALAALALMLMAGSASAGEIETQALYKTHCAECHGVDRLGGQGPALLPQNLKRLRKKSAMRVIGKGRAATQMPAFNESLSTKQIAALADYVYTPLDHVPEWGAAEITASHVVHKPELVEGDAKSARPVYDADPLNVFLVVETGDHHVTVLDGDKFEPIHRFKSRFALHGGPKYTSDGRFVYFASRDGWISKFDMYRLETVAEVRAGINTRNAAVSSDNRYVIVGNYLPHTLVILKASDLSLIKIIPVTDGEGNSSRVSAVYNAPPRNSFIVALKDIPEAWEIKYDDDPAAGFPASRGRDYRKATGDAAKPEPFQVRRIKVDRHLDDFFFDQDYIHLIGASREGRGQVINLDERRAIADLDLQGMPHLGSGITWRYGETTVLATPNLKKGEVTIIDTANWNTIKRLKTLGPGFFMRSHENSPYAWVDVFFGPNRDAMHVIDKKTLEIVRTLRPQPGTTAAHVEFDKAGRHALVSIWDKKGAVVVYDANTLEEVKRIPMSKPSGKYNVHNKITFSEGTSH